jgi:hypothetical protein
MNESKPNPMIANEANPFVGAWGDYRSKENEPYWHTYNQQWTCPYCGAIRYGTAALCDCQQYKVVTTSNAVDVNHLPANIVARLTMLEQKVEEMQKYIDNMRTALRNI